MAKLVTPLELTEIIAGLLLKPELLGELDTPEKHRALFLNLGEVVATHCGGLISDVTIPETDGTAVDGGLLNGKPVHYLEKPESTPYLVVHENECLPSPDQNVWMYVDTEGWVEEGQDLSVIPTPEKCESVRRELRQLVSPTIEGELMLTMQDWRLQEEELPVEDSKVYTVKATAGENLSVEVCGPDGESCFGFMLEVNQGVPALHINDGQNCALHLHAAHGGVVIAPDASDGRFDVAPVDRFSYQQKAMLIAFN
ncbi:hypothetical protein EXW94_26260 [Enterobacter sp. JMULE2]|uniref:hypothetical protein n=1 Tax=Enterobacter sp. JMULE2 TaxID=2518340 RepID=UPI001575EAA8|nr:hypothetical protein [Enterobacter sp. JMULE2]NTZ41105.1 hypothetical protein [Enterobacter sp. JMULE2]